MNDQNFWLLKINALLHDPPNKAFNIQGHESQSQDLANILNINCGKNDFKQADWIASAADRLNFPSYKSIGGANFRSEPYLTHPLAGVRLNLGKGSFLPTEIDDNQLQQAIKESLKSIHPDIKQDPKKLFLWLWRNWSNQIQRTDGNQLWALWDLLPADTRIPDHSIWAHQALTSAIAGTNSNPAFLLFTISPVQAFISAARRTQDLWAGSYLLSYLNWVAIQVIAEEIGPDAVVFPNLSGQPLCDRWLHQQGILAKAPELEDLILPSLPNRFLAIVPAELGESLARKATEKMRQQWRTITQKVRQDLDSLFAKPPAWSKIWERQTENLFETYWQVYPWRPTGKEPIQNKDFQQLLKAHAPYLGDRLNKIQSILKIYAKPDAQGGGQYQPNIGAMYSDLYFITEKALGSRKGLRNFVQVSETGEKSTLGGERAALYDGIDDLNTVEINFDRTGRKQIRNFWQQLAEKLDNLEVLDTGQERLDAVELTKRCAWRVYFKQELQLQHSLSQAVENPENNDNLHSQLKFPSTSAIATASFKQKVLEAFPNSNIDSLKQALQQWLDAVKKTPLIRGNSIPENVIPYLAKLLNKSQLSQSDENLLTNFLRMDGRLLLIETYDEELNKPLNKPHSKPNQTQIELALNALKNFLKIATKDFGLPKPRKYFAVLMMDGDNMGEWIAGDKMPQYQDVLHPTTKEKLAEKEDWKQILGTNRLMSPAIHGFVSKALGDFSLTLVRHIVENRYPGKLVYAGGDDVLALLPVDSVLEVARELRAAFSGEIFTGEVGTDKECSEFEVRFGKQKTGYIWLELSKGDKNSRRLLATMGHKATASTGITVAYYKQPLDMTLQEVRKAEKAAKSFGRNAFALTFLKRSGEIMHTEAKWNYNDKSLDTIEILKEFQKRFLTGEISAKFLYGLRMEAETLSLMNNSAIFCSEIKRLLKRQDAKHKLSEESINLLASQLANLAMQINLKNIADLLLFTRFLATGEGEEE
jgi:CRISPR-associated protein Cmr2